MLAHDSLAAQILRTAQDDMFDLLRSFVNVHHRVPTKFRQECVLISLLMPG